MVQLEFEVMFECLVDPRCSFEDLLNINKGPDKYDAPKVIFWDYSRATFIDHRGFVPNNTVSLLSRGVTFGHYVHLVERNTQVVKTGRNDPNEFDNLIHVPYINDNISPEIIRKPRYVWKKSTSSGHPKILIDTQNKRPCYFSPSLNRVRALGPDLDYNPMNYLEDLEEYDNPMRAIFPWL